MILEDFRESLCSPHLENARKTFSAFLNPIYLKLQESSSLNSWLVPSKQQCKALECENAMSFCYVPEGKYTHTHTLYIDTHWVHHTHKKSLGNSLAVQWLELCTSIAGAWVPSLARELTSCKPCDMVKKKVLIPRSWKINWAWQSCNW